MSFLTPFYLAGLAALALPLVFHFIRRSPSGEIPFSSLMFLSPSPPRLTRKSRLDQLLLLCLRAFALALLVAAFARPFFRQTATMQRLDGGQQRIAVLLDTSASMRRENLWEQAVDEVDKILNDCGPLDELAVFTFDERVRPLATFEEVGLVEPALRGDVVRQRIQAVGPTWAATNLGQALLEAVDAVSSRQDTTQLVGQSPRRVVLVSDLQAGSHLEALAGYPWPEDVLLELKPLSPSQRGNAGMQRLQDNRRNDAPSSDESNTFRVRLSNAADSQVDWFAVQWSDASGAQTGENIDIQVPAGENRVVRVPNPPENIDEPRLVLNGDAHSFDNTLYVVHRPPTEISVAYLGADAQDDPQGLHYYVERALTTDPSHEAFVQILSRDGELTLDEKMLPRLIVVTTDPSADQAEQLRRYAKQTCVILYVMTQAEPSDGLAALLDVEAVSAEEATVDDYTMLGEIDFDHRLFAPMSGPQFSDFTQIRFWKYRHVDDSTLPSLSVVARFENGDPAVLEQNHGRGRILVMTSGWHPDDSQLARTWKFVLMLSALVSDNGNQTEMREQYVVNENVSLPPIGALSAHPSITTPDGEQLPLPDDESRIWHTVEPGVYTMTGSAGPLPFAVNLNPSESDTHPLPKETLEQLGCRLENKNDAATELQQQRQLRDVELERQQQAWKWMIVVVCGVLCCETWLAGRLSRPTASHQATP